VVLAGGWILPFQQNQKKEVNLESENLTPSTSAISTFTGSSLTATPTTPEIVTAKSTGVSIQQEEKHDTLSTPAVASTAEVREVPTEVASAITGSTEKLPENAKENSSDDTAVEGPQNPRIERDVDSSESDKRENLSKEDTDEGGKKRPRNPGEKSSERSSKRARTNSPQFSADE